MSKKIPGNRSHLTLSDRIYIEQALYMRHSFKDIAVFLCKDPTTISTEVKRYVAWQSGYSARFVGHDCKYYPSCKVTCLCYIECGSLCKDCDSTNCGTLCSKYSPQACLKLSSPPYVCNGCQLITRCSYSKCIYSGEKANNRYKETLSASRRGINASPEEIERLDGIISPLIKNGQPLSHIFATHKDELGCSRQTIYNYVDMSLFSVRNIDLPRRIRYKIRKKKLNPNPIQYEYRNNRTYKDFLAFMDEHPDYDVVELDTVIGSRESGKCLLTMLFRSSNFMLIFLIPSCTQNSVREVFDYLYEQLGATLFRKTFPVILTDNGSEFKDPWSLERDNADKLRTRVFYCDPHHSNQKGKLEKNHEFIRYIIPKGKSMHNLTEEKVRLMACHINSLARDGLNGLTPFDAAKDRINKKVLYLLGLRKVSPDQVILKPTLLK